MFKEARIPFYKKRKALGLESSQIYKNYEKMFNKKVFIKVYKTWHDKANKNTKIKNIIDFDGNNFNSIKSLVARKVKM